MSKPMIRISGFGHYYHGLTHDKNVHVFGHSYHRLKKAQQTKLLISMGEICINAGGVGLKLT